MDKNNPQLLTFQERIGIDRFVCLEQTKTRIMTEEPVDSKSHKLQVNKGRIFPYLRYPKIHARFVSHDKAQRIPISSPFHEISHTKPL